MIRPKYLRQSVLTFITSTRGRGRVLFASDAPYVPQQRAVNEAIALGLDEVSRQAYLFDGAAALLSPRHPTWFRPTSRADL